MVKLLVFHIDPWRPLCFCRASSFFLSFFFFLLLLRPIILFLPFLLLLLLLFFNIFFLFDWIILTNFWTIFMKFWLVFNTNATKFWSNFKIAWKYWTWYNVQNPISFYCFTSSKPCAPDRRSVLRVSWLRRSIHRSIDPSVDPPIGPSIGPSIDPSIDPFIDPSAHSPLALIRLAECFVCSPLTLIRLAECFDPPSFFNYILECLENSRMPCLSGIPPAARLPNSPPTAR